MRTIFPACGGRLMQGGGRMWPISSWLLRRWRGELCFCPSFWPLLFDALSRTVVAGLVDRMLLPITDLAKCCVLYLASVVTWTVVSAVDYWRSASSQTKRWLLACRIFIVL